MPIAIMKNGTARQEIQVECCPDFGYISSIYECWYISIHNFQHFLIIKKKNLKGISLTELVNLHNFNWDIMGLFKNIYMKSSSSIWITSCSFRINRAVFEFINKGTNVLLSSAQFLLSIPILLGFAGNSYIHIYVVCLNSMHNSIHISMIQWGYTVNQPICKNFFLDLWSLKPVNFSKSGSRKFFRLKNAVIFWTENGLK